MINLRFIDFLIKINDIKSNIKSKLSRLFTVTIDIRKKSRSIIKFRSRSDYYGFIVIASTTEKNRKAIAWFYRTYKIPDMTDWTEFKYIFKLNEVPSHTIQLVDKNKKKLDKYITINSIDIDNGLSLTIGTHTKNIPISYGTLLPHRYLNNK